MQIKDLIDKLIRPQKHSLKIQSIRAAFWFENPALAVLIKEFRTEKQVGLELGTQVFGLAVSGAVFVFLEGPHPFRDEGNGRAAYDS